MGLFSKKPSIVRFNNGAVYRGSLKNGKPHGQGIYTFPDGSVFTGKLYNGTLVEGTLKYTDGTVYTGGFTEAAINGQTQIMKHGNGRTEYPNGAWHQGRYVSGEYDGPGEAQYPDGSHYKGNFVLGRKEGKGECIFPNQEQYKGSWASDMMHGKGTYTWPDGTTLTSRFQENLIVTKDGNISPDRYKNGTTGEDPDNISQKEEVQNYMDELNSLIGLEDVKAKVRDLITLIQMQQIRQQKGLKVLPISYHMVFTGNPGTGKTTVARIIGKLYHALGVTKNDIFIETDRSGLIGQYIGHTENKTNDVIDSALGGILFIDEAYSLVESQEGNDFGKQAINILLRRMENERDNLVVIAAGYDEPMDKFVQSNPGLKSRFTQFIDFPNYNVNDCLKILRHMAAVENYRVDANFQQLLGNYLTTRFKDPQFSQTFSNGRYIRNLLEKVKLEQSSRLYQLDNVENLSEEILCTITEDDLKPLILSGDIDKVS